MMRGDRWRRVDALEKQIDALDARVSALEYDREKWERISREARAHVARLQEVGSFEGCYGYPKGSANVS